MKLYRDDFLLCGFLCASRQAEIGLHQIMYMLMMNVYQTDEIIGQDDESVRMLI